MALAQSPKVSSPTSSSFLLSDSSASTASIGRLSRELQAAALKRDSTRSDSKHSLAPPLSPYIVEPSPVDSNGTDIEETAQEEDEARSPPDIDVTSPPTSATSEKPGKLDTQLPSRIRAGSSDDPGSVIHIRSGFRSFSEMLGSSDSGQAEDLGGSVVRSPTTPEAAISPSAASQTTPATSPLNTDVSKTDDRTTPLAQTRPDPDSDAKKSKRISVLQHIPESKAKPPSDGEDERPSTAELISDSRSQSLQEKFDDDDGDDDEEEEDEGVALTTALAECWTLCNTLATLSAGQRKRAFQHSGKEQLQERAWQSCWRLCQKLYDTRAEDHKAQVIPTLELCREFCQNLFEVRQRGDAVSDSVLRVSFELNNHLYNTADRNLPDAFSERTLDFYITLCHRLTKSRTSLPQETDALLRSCWNLAEMLFNLRQSRREARQPDEEQLGSAVQACWDLCDLFREGWSQVRPDRNTPKPRHRAAFPPPPATTTTTSHSTHTRSTGRSNSTLSDAPYIDAPSSSVPETPTTIFDDTTTASSPEDNMPNILVLGPARSGSSASQRGASGGASGTHHERWSSNASVMSDYSESAESQRTSSTTTASGDETHLDRLRYLLVKAAIDTGWTRVGQQLPQYAQNMSKTAFGAAPWQTKTLAAYRKLVTSDNSMVNAHAFAPKQIAAVDMAKSVKWLDRNESWAWLRDLYKIVFGFGVDDAERQGGSIQV